MSSTDLTNSPRCAPRFPADGVLFDNCVLARLWKCGALDALTDTVRLYAASQVFKEFHRRGPSERAALARLGVAALGVHPGSREWDFFAEIRGAKYSTRDLGEDESIAIALAQAERGVLLPLVTYDGPATKKAALRGVVALDFLDTLSWLVTCGVLTPERADAIEDLAGHVNGWKRPSGYLGSIEDVRRARLAVTVSNLGVWRRSS